VLTPAGAASPAGSFSQTQKGKWTDLDAFYAEEEEEEEEEISSEEEEEEEEGDGTIEIHEEQVVPAPQVPESGSSGEEGEEDEEEEDEEEEEDSDNPHEAPSGIDLAGW